MQAHARTRLAIFYAVGHWLSISYRSNHMYVLEPMPYIFGTFPSDFLKNYTDNVQYRFNGWLSHDVQNTSSSALRLNFIFLAGMKHLDYSALPHRRKKNDFFTCKQTVQYFTTAENTERLQSA